jgi:hypothetical protein
LGVIPSILALFLINIELFGGPMELSHKHWATGIEDKMLSISQFNRFTTPPFLGAFSILVHPTQGLLVNAPLVIFLFFMGLITFYKRNRTDFIALGCMYLLLFILYSGYTGTVFTPSRYFLAPLILSCEAVAYGIRFIFKNTDDIPKKS